MKLPRDLSGADLAKALRTLGYQISRQTGSHLRITTQVAGEHHEVIPSHSPLKVGTLHSILRNMCLTSWFDHRRIDREVRAVTLSGRCPIYVPTHLRPFRRRDVNHEYRRA